MNDFLIPVSGNQEYAVGLFLVTNLLAFIFIVCCYVYMYKTVMQSSAKLTRMIQSKEVRERQVGKQMAMIVLTDFCCWCPIIILGERLASSLRSIQINKNRVQIFLRTPRFACDLWRSHLRIGLQLDRCFHTASELCGQSGSALMLPVA